MANLTFDSLPAAVQKLSEQVEELKKLIVENNKAQQPEQPDQQSDIIVDVDGAADFLKKKKMTIYRQVSRGELPVMKRAGRLYFSMTELTSYLKGGRKKTSAEVKQDAEDYLNKLEKKVKTRR